MSQVGSMEAQNGYYRKKDDTIENFAVKDGFHITDTERNALAEGNSFVSGYIFDGVASNGRAVIHVKTGSKVCVMSYGVGSDGVCDYGVYKNSTISADGTQFGAFGRNMVTVKDPTTKTFRTPAITSDGAIMAMRTNNGASGPAKGGSLSDEQKVVIIPPNTSMLIIATNKSTTSSRINIVVDWIEVE